MNKLTDDAKRIFEESAEYANSIRDVTSLSSPSSQSDVCEDDFVLVLDDQSTGLKLFTQILLNMDKRLDVHGFTNPHTALEAAKIRRPALVISDYKMPEMDGEDFIKHFRSLPGCEDIPLIVVTVCEDLDVRYKVLKAGATDFLMRPLDHNECRARCENLLKLSRHQRQIANKQVELEEKVKQATEEIFLREQETLMRLARAGEYRDQETGMHVVRMAKTSALIARSLGLSEDECHEIELAAPMHDIGKIGITDTILLKEGRLTDDEREIMKTHAEIGYEILNGSDSKYIQLGADIALRHHEKWDGTGYPGALAGKDIPLPARIVAIADVYDALSSKRPYKEAWDLDDARKLIVEESGKHFDPKCVDAFIDKYDEIKLLRQQYPD